MFDLEPEAVTLDETRDALGELTNMMGGNLKALLPGPSRLSLPTVVEESGPGVDPLGNLPINQIAFECDGELLRVVFWEHHRGLA
jgi:chemotaxis protein CheX